MKESAPSFKQSSGETDANDEWLEKQFKNVETLDIEGLPLRVLEINPPDAKSEVPVVIAGGYGTSSPLHNKVNILEMVRQKRRTIFVDEPRGINRESEKAQSAEIEPFLMHQAEALIAALDKKEIAKTDAAGHSEGCMYIVAAAALYPERFRNLVLFNPGGMIGNDTFLKLGLRFISEIQNEIKRKKYEMSPAAIQQSKDGGAGFKKYLLEDKKKSIEELRSMAKQQIRDLIKQAHENGVGISIVHGVDDKVFPMERVQKQMSRTTHEEERIVDGFYSVEKGHGEFLGDPEKYTQVADKVLTALEEKQKKTAASEHPVVSG